MDCSRQVVYLKFQVSVDGILKPCKQVFTKRVPLLVQTDSCSLAACCVPTCPPFHRFESENAL